MDLLARLLGGFTDSFAIALGLWPLVSMFLTLPILAMLYRRDGRLRAPSVIGTYLSVLYVLGLGCLTLYPLPDGSAGPGITYGVPANYNPLAFIGDIAKDGARAVFQIVANVAFFVPLGFIASRLLRLGPVVTVALGLAASLLIETAQLTGLFGIYAFSYRAFDVDDLAWNTAGALLGWIVAAAVAKVLPPGALATEDHVTDQPGFVRRCVALWIDLMIIGLASGTADVIVNLAFSLAKADPSSVLGYGWTNALYVAAFIIVETVVPLRHKGSTPGGMFVRMTCETHELTGARRAVFHLVRTATLAAALFCIPIAAPVLLIFYLVKRKMPYDYI